MNKNWVLKGFGVMALFLSLAGAGFGANTFTWTNYAASGNYEATGNWAGGVAPSGTNDDVFFTNRVAYAVNVSIPITNRLLQIYGGEVTLSQPGSNFSMATLNIGNLAHQPTSTNALIISGATTVTLNSAAGFANWGQAYLNIKDGSKNGTYKLVVEKGAALTYPNGSLYLGGQARVGSTQIVVVADAGTVINFSSITFNSDSFNALYVTNGASIKLPANVYLNNAAAPSNLTHVSIMVVGGGSSVSIANMGIVVLNSMGLGQGEVLGAGTPRRNTSELTVLTNGRTTQKSYLTIYPGGTLTLAGGCVELIEGGATGNINVGGMIQGAGTIQLSKNGAIQAIRLVGHTNTTASITNCGAISPGTADSPIGTIVVSNYTASGANAAYMMVSNGCSLNFDLAGTLTNQYDCIMATNMAVYLGVYASPYTVQGGATINVALRNNFVPASGDTFDLLVARKIYDVSLAPVIFNFPVQPANLTWTPSIFTNTTVGKSNEVLRLTVSGGRPTGTLFMIN